MKQNRGQSECSALSLPQGDEGVLVKMRSLPPKFIVSLILPVLLMILSSASGRLGSDRTICTDRPAADPSLPAWVREVALTNRAASVETCETQRDQTPEVRHTIVSAVVVSSERVLMRSRVLVQPSDLGSTTLLSWPGTASAALDNKGQPRVAIEMSRASDSEVGLLRGFAYVAAGITPAAFIALTEAVHAALREPDLSSLLKAWPISDADAARSVLLSSASAAHYKSFTRMENADGLAWRHDATMFIGARSYSLVFEGPLHALRPVALLLGAF